MTSNDKSKTVLLVDDEADIRVVLEMSLADMGYRVLTAENAAAALKCFTAEQPELVLTDIKMPGMDGIELLRRIKHENPETEVIMITGHGDMNLAVKSLQYEATDFITKPIHVDSLEVALKRACDRRTMREKLDAYTRHLERLIQEKTELQDHLASLGLLIGSVSHGIKGLMSGMDGGIYLMDSGFEKNDPQRVREGWKVVKVMTERIRKMVLDILYYAKERALKWEEVDLRRFVEEVLLVVKPKARDSGVGLETSFDADLDAVTIDPGAVHASLVNILENAVDACVRDRSKPDHTVRLSVCQEKDHILFHVADDGVGIDPEKREKLFELFYSSKGDKGTGLGLFIAHRIVAQHGGRITVDSRPGKGAVFTIRIPRVLPGQKDAGNRPESA